MTDADSDEWNTLDKEKKDKLSMWMQCDKCKYTTNYNSFMVHHIRQTHNEDDDDSKEPPTGQQKTQIESTDKGEGSKLQDSKVETLPLENMEIIGSNKISEDELSGTLVTGGGVRKEESMSDESETVEMIAAEISEFTDERVLISNSAVEASQDSQSEPVREVSSEDQEHVALQVAAGDDSIDGANTICMVDESGIIVQKMEQGEDGTLYVQVVENPDSTKQVLSVAEDGSVQMVEVMWDEMVNPEAVEDDNIPF